MIERLVQVMARRCGLLDPVAFAARVRTRWREDKSREGRFPSGTGWTTRVLLKALVCASAGARVVVEVRDEEQGKRSRERLQELSKAAGIPDRVHREFVSHSYPGARCPRDADVYLCDR